MGRKNERRFEMIVEFKHQTDDAVLVTDGSVEAWLPKSQISYDKDLELKRGDILTIDLPEWLAEDKGLI